LIHSESAFRLLVHAGASFHEVALFAGSGVSVAELRDNVRLMSLTVRAPTLHFRAGHALRVTRPENAANFWLSQRVDDADESRIEFGPYAVLGNVTVSGTRVRTVFGERAHALSVYAQTNGAYAADHVSSLLMLQGV